MEKEELKLKILERLKKNGNVDKWHEGQIASLVFILAKDHTDLNNSEHKLQIYNALCELEKEGKVVNSCSVPTKDLNKAMLASRWYLK